MKDAEFFPAHAKTPGLHALIVGVSEYSQLLAPEDPTESPVEHLGMRKLTSAATAAHRVASYLVERADKFAVPLASCRLLLSPSPDEALADIAPRATFANFKAIAHAWRKDAARHAGNMTLFYFAGHGLLRNNGAQVLVFEDFATPPGKLLQNCLEAFNLLDGMAMISNEDAMARTQLYFFDACRAMADEVKKYDRREADKIWDPREPPEEAKEYRDARLMPQFRTEPGGQAFGLPGVGSVFSESLIRCLKGAAADFDRYTNRWSVTVQSLVRLFDRQVDIVARECEVEQKCKISEAGGVGPLHSLDGPPMVDIEITLDPPDKRPHAKIFAVGNGNDHRFDLGAPVPDLDRRRVPAGLYEVYAVPDGRLLDASADLLGFQQNRSIEQAEPPFSPWPLRVK
jgi:hypothetical protein